MVKTMICPRCNKSREFYDVREWDKKKSKYWVITRCQKCAYNADISEGTNETGIDTREGSEDGYSWDSDRRW